MSIYTSKYNEGDIWDYNFSAVECFDALKMSYGTHNCFLLKTNSKQADHSDDQLPDPWSQFLSARIQYSEDITPESSPSTSAADLTLETGDENVLSYHPLSPEGDKLLVNIFLGINLFS